ncbi:MULTISPECIES: MEKHLA domain-containing protein [Fischerella]|uniref:MEKHLA domain-containing protein n=1 Tax=Fischerella muscicola CCMEE 5323 TaxID=2019572 RepID=A0A2N6K3Z6_FISMU|nr:MULTISPECIES: MEKHLA domain-containing protein [Fischerella]MBD2431568.1 MEKHLA domain-containing protein [Fischerella sp. FACHB-380]PLZ90517.1 MEKHLA domain-containing protein [Fischerella muscicola CCMEE 5323]
MTNNIQLPWQQETVICHSLRLLRSFEYWTGRSLLDVNGSAQEIAQALFAAPFVLVSHGTEPDPIFNYGNRKALELWELSWHDFTRMPSRKTTEEVVQEERSRLLAETTSKGFSNYSGVRISSTGKRFYIKDGILWNLLDENDRYCGQAAVFSNYEFML